jgi:formate--tetrahydrofolate ligase
LVKKHNVPCVLADHWASGSAGAEGLAQEVVRAIETQPSKFKLLYPDDMPLAEKIRTVSREIYGAADIALDPEAAKKLKEFEKEGFGAMPVCIAKTQFSFTTDPAVKGAPSGHIIPVRGVRLSAGAEFVVALCGDILTMPGLPRVPAANSIAVTPDGKITGLF